MNDCAKNICRDFLVMTLMLFAESCALAADLVLGSPFADHMVLQRDRKVPVWGWTTPGDKVTVSFAGKTKETVASTEGRWRVDLDPMPASKTGRALVVTSQTPQKSQTVKATCSDILVGEVWYCSGQSNAECPLVGPYPRFRDGQGSTVAQMTVKPFIRYCYACDYKIADKPREKATYPVVWRPFTPENLSRSLRPGGSDGFSAIGVYFALDLYSALEIPIGIVGSWYGGSRIEPWTPACGYELAGVKPIPDKSYARDRDAPSKMWNEMVEPWCPMAMRGFIWYQGCANATQPETYTGYMHALYKGWAKKFENPGLRIYFAQLTSWGEPKVVPIQEAQAKFAEEEPNAAMAVIEDSGNRFDVHPNNKQVVGRRLALHALRRDYGFDWIENESPVLRDWRVAGDKFVLEFDHAQGFYFYNPDYSATNGFEICGEDGVWRPAEYANGSWHTIWQGTIRTGQILGDNVVVYAPGVPHPKKLRYLHSFPWSATLFNQVNLPIGPFHVDTPTRRGRTDTVLSSRALPDPTPGRRQFVRLEGVTNKVTVIVNGKAVGTHAGANSAFACELTRHLKKSGNEIEIRDGRCRDVHFIETDRVCVDSVTEGRDNIAIEANPKTGDVVARVKVLGGTNEVRRFSFPKPALWSQKHPNTYYLTVEVKQNGYDAITVPFVFRAPDQRPTR